MTPQRHDPPPYGGRLANPWKKFNNDRRLTGEERGVKLRHHRRGSYRQKGPP